MPLLNYTTSIETEKTISQIQRLLIKYGVTGFRIDYKEQQASALAFKVDTPQGDLAFRLPVNIDTIMTVLGGQGVRPRLRTREQATRIAWRIIKDWVEAQMALLQTEMVTMEEIFLPYLITGGGRTLFQTLQQQNFQLPEGRD